MSLLNIPQSVARKRFKNVYRFGMVIVSLLSIILYRYSIWIPMYLFVGFISVLIWNIVYIPRRYDILESMFGNYAAFVVAFVVMLLLSIGLCLFMFSWAIFPNDWKIMSLVGFSIVCTVSKIFIYFLE